jgi:putative peptide zinc metalloprotease protein
MRLPTSAQRLRNIARSWAEERRTADVERPTVAPGVELVGEYKGSGFKDAPYIVRAADGQVIQLPRLLFLIAACANGQRTVREIGEAVGEQVGRRLSPDNVQFAVDTKLRPAGIVAARDGTAHSTPRVDPLLALRLRAAVVPARFVRAISSVCRPLFHPFVIGTAISWLIVFDLWLAHHGLAAAAQELLMHPLLMLAVLGLVVVATAWHEIGHATACRYGGATPGPIGVGLYLVWPAFYTDVTDAYRLDRTGRLRTDLGGVYFNGLFVLATAGAWFATGFEPLLAVIAIQHVQVIQQLMPFARFDGYYVITDLVGVADISRAYDRSFSASSRGAARTRA